MREHRADLLVFSGDITQRARRGQFASAAAFVRRLEADGVGDTLVIPGNHDIPLYNVFARLFTPTAITASISVTIWSRSSRTNRCW